MLKFSDLFHSKNPSNGLIKGEMMMDYLISFGLSKEILNLVKLYYFFFNLIFRYGHILMQIWMDTLMKLSLLQYFNYFINIII